MFAADDVFKDFTGISKMLQQKPISTDQLQQLYETNVRGRYH